MLDLLRKYVDSLAGITELPRERAERLVRDLLARGEIRSRDLQRAAQELVDRSVRNRRELIGLMQKEIRRQVKSLGLVTREEHERLSRRVKALEKGAKPSSRGGAKKTSPARKSTSTPKS